MDFTKIEIVKNLVGCSNMIYIWLKRAGKFPLDVINTIIATPPLINQTYTTKNSYFPLNLHFIYN